MKDYKKYVKNLAESIIQEMKSSTYYSAAKKADAYGHKNLADRFRKAGDAAVKNEQIPYFTLHEDEIGNWHFEVLEYNDINYLIATDKKTRIATVVDLDDISASIDKDTLTSIKNIINAKDINTDKDILKTIIKDKREAIRFANDIRHVCNANISWRLFIEENPIFSEEQTPEEEVKQAKFNFEKIAEKTIDGVDFGVVRIMAKNTTGYEVYYLQVIVDWPHNIRPKQAFVIRILKQLRGCKVLSFGNPALVYNFLGKRKDVCEPNRATSNTEIFKKVLLNTLQHVTSKKIIDWAAKEMNAPLAEKSFGITLNPSATYIEKKSAESIKKVEKTVKAITTDEKKELVHKAIKAIIAEKKKDNKGKDEGYIRIYPYDIYEKIKNAEKIWGNDEKFAEDLSWNSLCYMDIPKYIEKVDVVDPWSGSKYVSCIKYIMKRCKEFDSLNLYIKNVLKCKELGLEDVKKEDIAGKRSSIFDRWGTKLLAHSPETCKNIKAWCQKNKAGNWHGEIEKKHYTYWGDRYNSYGEDRECEWDGYEDDYIIIRLVTPTGKVKAQQEFHVY